MLTIKPDCKVFPKLHYKIHCKCKTKTNTHAIDMKSTFIASVHVPGVTVQDSSVCVIMKECIFVLSFVTQRNVSPRNNSQSLKPHFFLLNIPFHLEEHPIMEVKWVERGKENTTQTILNTGSLTSRFVLNYYWLPKA